eukprot:9398323-Prorocentrum_lima.AAC.1
MEAIYRLRARHRTPTAHQHRPQHRHPTLLIARFASRTSPPHPDGHVPSATKPLTSFALSLIHI